MFSLNPYRKKMFVSSRIQGRLMFRIGLYWVLYHVVLWHALFVYRYIQHRWGQSNGQLAVPFHEMYGTFVIDYYPLILCAVITLPVVIIDMLHMTHRVAGPLVRFKNALHDLKAGKEITKVSLRKGDLLTEFQDEFNQYLDFLAEQRQSKTTSAGESMSEDEARILSQVSDLRQSVQQAVNSNSETEVPVEADA